MIRGREKGSAPDVAERRHKRKVRRYRSGIPNGSTSLMIKKVDAETGIDRRLIGIGRRTPHLVQAEPGEKSRFIGKAMIDSYRKLVCVRRDL